MTKKVLNHAKKDGKKVYRVKSRVEAAKRDNKKQVTWLWGLWGSHFAA